MDGHWSGSWWVFSTSSLRDFMDDFFDFLVVLVATVPVSGATVVAPPVLVCT
jgi:hypothetical protein